MENIFKDLPLHHLHTGKCLVTKEPTLVSTILGSCVAVTMYAPRMKCGGVCHAFLPSAQGGYPDVPSYHQECRFVDAAIDHLLSGMSRLGARPEELEIKLFGGSASLTLPHQNAVPMGVGDRNIQVARQTLEELGLTVIKADTGGRNGRKLMFLSHTGGVWLKRLGKVPDEHGSYNPPQACNSGFEQGRA
ncbi:MAG: chemotaxis protein CheD [Desulfovibrionales bacterium]|jgi:chemotaxis protein CheD|nr:chemotaxis protein CheD [Desulfovibrionales bacterium]